MAIDVYQTIDLNTDWSYIPADQNIRSYNRSTWATNKGARSPDEYHPMSGGLDLNDQKYQSYLTAQGVTMLGVMPYHRTAGTLGTGGFDELLKPGEWRDAYGDRASIYSSRKADFLMDTLDGIVNHLGLKFYLQIMGFPECVWDGQTKPTIYGTGKAIPLNCIYNNGVYNVVWSLQNRMFAMFESIERNNFVMSTVANRAKHFMADIIQMVAEAYPSTYGDYIFYVGCETDPLVIHSHPGKDALGRPNTTSPKPTQAGAHYTAYWCDKSAGGSDPYPGYDGTFGAYYNGQDSSRPHGYYSSAGPTPGYPFPHSSDAAACKAQSVFYKALCDEVVVTRGLTNAKIGIGDFIGLWGLRQFVGWQYSQMLAGNTTPYMSNAWSVQCHPYPLPPRGDSVQSYRTLEYGNYPEPGIFSCMTQEIMPRLRALKTKFGAQMKYTPTVNFPQYGYSCDAYDPGNVSWQQGIYFAYMHMLSYYCKDAGGLYVKHCAPWDDISMFGFYKYPGSYPNFNDAGLYPSYYAIKMIKDVINPTAGDAFCQNFLTDYTDITCWAMRKRATKGNIYLIYFNRGYYAYPNGVKTPAHRTRNFQTSVKLRASPSDQNWPDLGTWYLTVYEYTKERNSPYYSGVEGGPWPYWTAKYLPTFYPVVKPESILILKIRSG